MARNRNRLDSYGRDMDRAVRDLNRMSWSSPDYGRAEARARRAREDYARARRSGW